MYYFQHLLGINVSFSVSTFLMYHIHTRVKFSTVDWQYIFSIHRERFKIKKDTKILSTHIIIRF